MNKVINTGPLIIKNKGTFSRLDKSHNGHLDLLSAQYNHFVKERKCNFALENIRAKRGRVFNLDIKYSLSNPNYKRNG